MTLTDYERDKVVQSLIKAAGDTGEYPTDEEIEIACEKARRAKDMTDEKGEVIARWLGFQLAPPVNNPAFIPLWTFPDGSCHRELPDFTDLTTLFKWCVPKLDYCNIRVQDSGVIYAVAGINNRSTGRFYGATPGEALRGAIVALIGEGDEND